MTTEEMTTNDSAQTGAPDPQIATAATATPPAGFSPEQQAAIDKLVAERLTRAREKWAAEQEAKAKADADAAEAERQKAQGEWEALARKHEGKAAELDSKLQTTAADLERATTLIAAMLDGKKEGLPEPITKLLEGRSLFEQLEIVDAYLAAQPAAQPAGAGRVASTTPTPAAQGRNGLTPEERRRAATRTF